MVSIRGKGAWSEKWSTTKVDSDGHHSKATASAVWPHLQNSGRSAVTHWCWGWWKAKENQDDQHGGGLATSWCSVVNIKGAIMVTEDRDNWRRFVSTGKSLWSPRQRDSKKKKKWRNIFKVCLVGNITTLLFHISCWFWQWKNFENQLSFWLDSSIVFWTPWHKRMSTYSQPSFSSSAWNTGMDNG